MDSQSACEARSEFALLLKENPRSDQILDDKDEEADDEVFSFTVHNWTELYSMHEAFAIKGYK